MQTSNEWWAEVKLDPAKFNDWLVKQHRGEVTAASRIRSFADAYAPDPKSKKVLDIIARQEEQHAGWVADLLRSRGIEPNIDGAEARYWREVLPSIESFETGAAVGAHAEAMRLERIKVICDDAEAPEDVRAVFQRILKDELFHERSFRRMAGSAYMAATLVSHDRGRELLGLVP